MAESDDPSCGLHLNRSKSLLFISEEADASSNPLPAEIPIFRSVFILLGCPLGPPSYCEEIFMNRVEKVKLSLASLPLLPDSQVESTLLRSCLSLPKISYSLHTCPPIYIRRAIGVFDQAMRDALEDLVGAPLPDLSLIHI